MAPPQGTSWIKNLIYNAAVHSAKWGTHWPFRSTWQACYKKLCEWNVPVQTSIHDHDVIVNSGYTYPIFIRRYPNLNKPLIELVYQTHRALQRPISFVDVGAAIGDTVLLVDSHCAGMVNEYICFDGDAEFFGYLERNLDHLGNCRCILKLLSSQSKSERSLVRIHGGTASSQGQDKVQAESLDDAIATHKIERVDILKIDVDGFDGEVLRGSTELLIQQHPAVIFEWHPILCLQTGNNYTDHFSALANAGYRNFAWFTKFGLFSHFSEGYQIGSIEQLAQLCLKSTSLIDWHYDVVALPPHTDIDVLSLADLGFSRRLRLEKGHYQKPTDKKRTPI